jgi:actin-related protein
VNIKVDDYNTRTVMMDNGTAFSRIGFAGEDKPSIIIPTFPTSPIRAIPSKISPVKEINITRQKPLIRKRFTQGTSPLERGVIKDWSAMERFWQQVFNDWLRIDPSTHPLILSETPLNPKPKKDKMAEIMFEKFNVPSLFIPMQATLSLYASNRTTGCVVDIGEGVTKIVPISEGYALTHAIQIMDIAGQDITKYLLGLLRQAGYMLTSSAEKEYAIDIKEKLCYIASDLKNEKELMKKISSMEKIYKIPDGTEIKLKSELFMAPECLFNPILIGKEILPLHESIIEAISLCDMTLRNEFYSNIILSGGSTKFPGIEERLKKEITKNVPTSIEVNIIAPQQRELSTWIGGSIIGALSTFHEIAITRQQYKQTGLGY